jgi:hypothetical protein
MQRPIAGHDRERQIEDGLVRVRSAAVVWVVSRPSGIGISLGYVCDVPAGTAIRGFVTRMSIPEVVNAG